MKTYNEHARGRVKRKIRGGSSFARVLQDFTCNTSIHGVKYLDDVSQKSGQIAKFFWISVLISAFVGSSLMLKLFWDRYQAHPVVSAIESFYASSFRTAFPAVTVCSMIGPDPELRSRLLQKLKLPCNVSQERASSLLRQAFEMAHLRADMFEDRGQLNELLEHNGIRPTEFLIGLRIPCEKVVQSCWWEGEKISCLKFFKRSFTFGGLCCSFNYRLEDHLNPARKTERLPPLEATNYGINSGLTLVFEADQFIINDDNGNIERITSTTVGLLVFVHHSLVYPDSTNLIMQAQREMQLRVSPMENRKVPGLVGEHESPCNPQDVKIEYFDEYWRENCYNSCRIRASLALCRCVPWHFSPFVLSDSICSFSQMKCLQINYQEIWSVMYQTHPVIQCFCPPRCNMRTYDATPTIIPLASEFFCPSPIYSNVTTENAVLRIYLGEQVYDKTGNYKVADEIYLLSSIGGIFSLFLGCSILSLCEIIYFLYILIKS